MNSTVNIMLPSIADVSTEVDFMLLAMFTAAIT